MARKLIINADDYGYLDYIDDAIIESIKNQVVSSVSCFANMDKEMLELKMAKLLDTSKDVGIGLHLSITAGKPITDCNNIMKEDRSGYFKECPEHRLKNLSSQTLDQIDIEINAQAENLASVIGKDKIDSISCHHNILNLDDKLFHRYAALAKKYSAKLRSPRRSSQLKRFKKINKHNPTAIPPSAQEALRMRPRKNFFRLLFAMLKKNVADQEDYMIQNNLKGSDYFLINIYGNANLNVLKDAYPLIEQDEMCEQIMHLGLPEFGIEASKVPSGINSKYFTGRAAEYDLLTSVGFAGLLNKELNSQNPIQLVNHKGIAVFP